MRKMVGWVEVEHLHPIELLWHIRLAVALVVEPKVWDGRQYGVVGVRRGVLGVARSAESANLLIYRHPIAKANHNLLEMHIFVDAPFRAKHADHIARRIVEMSGIDNNTTRLRNYRRTLLTEDIDTVMGRAFNSPGPRMSPKAMLAI